MKRCARCGEHKPADRFPRHKRTKDGLYSYCKPCHRENQRGRRWARSPEARERDLARTREHREANRQEYLDYMRAYSLQRRYGITVDEHQRLHEAQDGRCAICGTDKPGGRHGTFHVDHDHTTGEVRGLLCFNCNVLLGGEGTAELLRSAIAYLEDPPAVHTIGKRYTPK